MVRGGRCTSNGIAVESGYRSQFPHLRFAHNCAHTHERAPAVWSMEPEGLLQHICTQFIAVRQTYTGLPHHLLLREIKNKSTLLQRNAWPAHSTCGRHVQHSLCLCTRRLMLRICSHVPRKIGRSFDAGKQHQSDQVEGQLPVVRSSCEKNAPKHGTCDMR